ncbi:hypothetical protein ACWGH8_41835 [Nonomuraea muscovyensis]|uniref:Uncharacterized protein n=1 Tax=Nonomuraea muscovyensis TaxID=1124761 RepID=A0A7X0C304_9ACTN|nr:hypothetical protein [Nonomuraea muscovyensis]MBB6346741.1 hypothetical protein [Nonomuraea muscovyensis]MDF2709868.1 hypothetical protein [Nonomuraea muscovyensis]
MDGESLAATGLLAALSRAAELLAGLRHPFVRSEPYTYAVPPAGARTGIAFTLPDGRELRLEVSISAEGGAFHVAGAADAEGDVLLGLPHRAIPGIHDALVVFDDYAAELAGEAGRLVDGQLDEIV